MLDPLLRRFVETADEAEAQRELNALIEQHALPLAKAIVGRKLRSYREGGPDRADGHDRDDVVADAMVTLIERLRDARADTDGAPIESFINYAAAVIHSACAHHIRRRYPERARLKNRLRYVFSTERQLALWTTDDAELVCGLAEWRGRSSGHGARQTVSRLVEQGERRWMAMSRGQLVAATVDLVVSIGGPVEFEMLVGAAASAARLVEPRDAGDPSVLPSREPAHEVLIDQRRFLGRVWEEIVKLPVRQRLALLLNLRNTTGGGLLWLLPIAGVATIRQIAHVLEIADAEFARLWREMPLDDATIGQRLGCTRQQVINLRMAARKRLMNRVEAGTSSATGPSGGQANLAQVSPSLKGSA